LATNRYWVTDAGEKKEETEFHRIVAWNKLAELCSQLLFKGRKVFVEGRLQTRQWTAQDGTPRQTTEIIISDMIILDSKRAPGEEMAEVVPEEPVVAPEEVAAEVAVGQPAATPVPPADDSGGKTPSGKKKAIPADEESASAKVSADEEVKAEDIPF
jgi:single-strand DNA-binding protein